MRPTSPRRAFGAALLRLAARTVTPRWATLALTLEAADPDWLERFSAAAAAVCEASGVELAGGDTTRGPGRATVFALGAGTVLPHRPEPRPRTAAIGVRLSLVNADAPEHADRRPGFGVRGPRRARNGDPLV